MHHRQFLRVARVRIWCRIVQLRSHRSVCRIDSLHRLHIPKTLALAWRNPATIAFHSMIVRQCYLRSFAAGPTLVHRLLTILIPLTHHNRLSRAMHSNNTIRINSNSSSCSSSRSKHWLRHKQPCPAKWVGLQASDKGQAHHLAREAIPSKQSMVAVKMPTAVMEA